MTLRPLSLTVLAASLCALRVHAHPPDATGAHAGESARIAAPAIDASRTWTVAKTGRTWRGSYLACVDGFVTIAKDEGATHGGGLLRLGQPGLRKIGPGLGIGLVKINRDRFQYPRADHAAQHPFGNARIFGQFANAGLFAVERIHRRRAGRPSNRAPSARPR